MSEGRGFDNDRLILKFMSHIWRCHLSRNSNLDTSEFDFNDIREEDYGNEWFIAGVIK